MKRPEPVGLSQLVRQVRMAKGWSTTQLGVRMGYAQPHISQIENERSRHPGGWIPSEAFLRKFSEVCTSSVEEEALLRQRLLVLRAREVVPVEVRGYLSSSVQESMPAPFLTRVQRDVGRARAATMKRVDRVCGLEGRLGFVLQGFGHLTPLEVGLVAHALTQPADQYLLLAGYVSDGMRALLEDDAGCATVLDVIAGVSPTTRREFEDFHSRTIAKAQKKPVKR